jgi:hypothetical protein
MEQETTLDKLIRYLVDIAVDDIMKESQRDKTIPNLSKARETVKK